MSGERSASRRETGAEARRLFGNLPRFSDIFAWGLFMAGGWFLLGANANFPLNDDWAYTSSVRRLLEEGTLRLSDWAGPLALPMIFSAAGFCKLFGFGHPQLRIVTLFWSLMGLFFLNKIMDRAGVAPSVRRLTTAVLFFNPLYFLLSYSFHTDIAFLALTFASIHFLRECAEDENPRAEVAASIFCAAAALTRQIGILLPLSAAAWWAYRGNLNFRRLARLWLFPAAGLLGAAIWFRWGHGPTWAQTNYVWGATLKHIAQFGPFALETMRRGADALLLSSLFAFPLLFLKPEKGKPRNLRAETILAIVLLALSFYVLDRGRTASFLDNIFHRKGLGTLTIYDHGWKPVFLWDHPWIWNGLAALSVCSLWVFLRRFVYAAWSREQEHLLLLTLPIAWATLVGFKFFDRYLFQWLAVLLLLLPTFTKGTIRKGAWAAVGMWCVLAWAGGRDYFAWNRAKWELGLEAARYLGVSPGRIANGFDWNAHWNYEVHMSELKREKPLAQIGEWEWERLDRAQAIISYSPEFLPADQRILSLTYRSPLAPQGAQLYAYALAARPTRDRRTLSASNLIR